MDSFLFEEEHIDALEAEGKLKRNYCEKCGSLDVAPISKYFFLNNLIMHKKSYYLKIILLIIYFIIQLLNMCKIKDLSK